MGKITITDALVSDLKRYGEKVCVGLATTVRDKLEKETVYAIEQFYEDYTPISYKRHYYNFENNSYTKYYKNSHGSIVYGGILLSPENMDDIYQDPTEEVFDFIYHGFHGVSSGFDEPKSFSKTPVMSPSPLEMIMDERDRFIDNIDDYKDHGIDRAKNEKYSTIYV